MIKIAVVRLTELQKLLPKPIKKPPFSSGRKGVFMSKKKNGKKLKIMNEEDYGFTVDGKIHVNVERIWHETSTDRQFINAFAQTYHHELLHLVLARVRKKTDLGEEKVIRKLLSEPWTLSMEQSYKEEGYI